jgi:hypothetical protein
MSENQELSNENTEVEIIDDTPKDDRNRTPLPPKIVDELEKDNLDEYSDKVKQRLSQMRKLAHDERREKEKFARERDEAMRVFTYLQEENKKLKQRVSVTEKVFAKETTEAAGVKVQAAEDALKRAYEAGDAEKLVKAQKELNDAQLLLRERNSFRPSVQEPENSVQNQPQTQAPAPQSNRPAYDPKAVAWQDRNTWFGTDEEMTALALGVHEKLVRSGVDPRSDDYYRRVDETMKKRFPDYFGDEEPQNIEEEDKPAPRKVSTVVAPAARSTAPRKIKITASQAAIAKKLGISPEAYAREVMKLGD